jgi:hypothetical protein
MNLFNRVAAASLALTLTALPIAALAMDMAMDSTTPSLRINHRSAGYSDHRRLMRSLRMHTMGCEGEDGTALVDCMRHARQDWMEKSGETEPATSFRGGGIETDMVPNHRSLRTMRKQRKSMCHALEGAKKRDCFLK